MKFINKRGSTSRKSKNTNSRPESRSALKARRKAHFEQWRDERARKTMARKAEAEFLYTCFLIDAQVAL